MTTLNFEAGGDIAKNLYQLYDYMYFRLVRANIDKNIDYVKEVKKIYGRVEGRMGANIDTQALLKKRESRF